MNRRDLTLAIGVGAAFALIQQFGCVLLIDFFPQRPIFRTLDSILFTTIGVLASIAYSKYLHARSETFRVNRSRQSTPR